MGFCGVVFWVCCMVLVGIRVLREVFGFMRILFLAAGDGLVFEFLSCM